MAQFTYMGTKRLLASRIARAASKLPDGAFLELFSGISAAGAAIAPQRPIWCNDAQAFSATLTSALYTSREPIDGADLRKKISRGFLENNGVLSAFFSRELFAEEEGYASSDVDQQIELQALTRSWTRDLPRPKLGGVHCLFTLAHAGSYFSLRQAIDIDSLRAGADKALAEGRISFEQHRWAVLAICRAISSVSNSTGHFAQYLTAKRANLPRVLSKRRRDVVVEWMAAAEEMTPLGSAAWRIGNRTFKGDAISLLEEFKTSEERPSVVYADPPYTDDQYSRFYHLLENAVLYDYPCVSGKGEYRSARFTSGFSLKSAVKSEFCRLVSGAAEVAQSIIISYPKGGLLEKSERVIPSLLREHYRNVGRPMRIEHLHSTLGGSKGAQKQKVEERIYVASDPR